MDPAALDYQLPQSAIAQQPAEPRDAARLLVDRGRHGGVEHLRVSDLPSLLGPGDLLVLNDTRVLPARLQLRRDSGGRVELLLLERRGGDLWEALARPARKLGPGTELLDDAGAVVGVVVDQLGEGVFDVRIEADAQRMGEVALPPYIREPLADAERYQTVYARRPGSAAAPTAGLHITEELLDRCRARGVAVAALDLAIGLDTFRPITEQAVEAHRMHSEAYAVPEQTWEACRSARRVVAVGTTVVRALEATAASGELEGRTALFIREGFAFQVVDVLLTNFHLPRTTLLALLDAFMGPRWRDLYEEALREGYRFLSFGDAMLVERSGSDRG